MSVSSLNFLKQVFLPSASPPTRPVSFLDYAGEWTEGAEGSADCLSLIACVAEWVKLFGPQSRASIAEIVRVKCDDFKSMRIIPLLFSDVKEFCHSVRNWSQTDSLAMAKSCKKVAMKGLSLIGTGAQAVLLGENLKIASLSTRQMCCLNVISNATLLLMDGVDFVGNCLELCQETKSEKRGLAWLNFTTNGTSVALSALSLGTLFLSRSRPWIARVTLPLSTVYLVAKLSSHFYKKMRVECLG
jgi:hypothetical protein